MSRHYSLAFLLFSCILVAGCDGPRSPSQFEPVLSIRDGCQRLGQSHCTETSQYIRIREIHIDVGENRVPGIFVWNLTKDLIIEDSTIRAFGAGIAISDVDACNECTVTVRNVSIEWLGELKPPEYFALLTSPIEDFPYMNETQRISWELENVSISGHPSGLRFIRVGNLTIDNLQPRCGDQALQVIIAESVTIRNTHIMRCEKVGAAIQGSKRITITDSIFTESGLGLAVAGQGSEYAVTIERAEFRGNRQALTANLVDLRLRDSAIVQTRAQSPPASAICSIGAVCITNSGGSLHNNTIEGNEGFAVYATTSFEATNNWWGDPAGPRVKVRRGDADVPPIGLGMGDVVNEKVSYRPYLQSRP